MRRIQTGPCAGGRFTLVFDKVQEPGSAPAGAVLVP